MASSHNQPTDQKDLDRLRQLEQQLERSQWQAESTPVATSTTASPASTPRWGWGKTLGSLAVVGIGFLVLGWLLNLVGLVLKLALVAGGVYLLYRLVLAPRLRAQGSRVTISSELESE